MGAPEVKEKNFPRISMLVPWGHQKTKSKISQDFLRSPHGVTRGQKAKFPKNSQDQI
ncbi:hypothetical protein HOLleu_25080 [Holothuria leucospilota]|uniref:Uncharacterized protein n=1 Tax=Holothuria leucospilota TaxID=206669 RepID=A0A9Q1BRK2_HOLLE|nr:hypothetical protein HOLleu_25080 [Holothuria leucospilota]